MIPKVIGEMVNYGAKRKERSDRTSYDKKNKEIKVLPSNAITRTIASFNRTSSAATEYWVKGLNGDINSNFYEFLAMGRIPYWLGGATFIGIFNGMSRFFDSRGSQQAKRVGLKLATGVVFYSLAKMLSKEFVTRPVAMATGIDIDQPYLNVAPSLPKTLLSIPPKPDDDPKKPSRNIQDLDSQYQYQKLWESVEFPRIDLVKPEFFDNVARKNGLGSNLNNAETEAKPILKNVISTATTATRISSFLWAACGVALATCGNWNSYYETYLSGNKFRNKPISKKMTFNEKMKVKLDNFWQNTKEGTVALGKTFKDSAKEFYHGTPGSSGFKKHAGKALLFTAIGSTVFGVANTIIRARSMGKNLCDKNIIDNTKDSMVV